MIQTSQTNEAALESHIEKALLVHGYVPSVPAEFNTEFAVDEAKFWEFLKTTQAEELEKLRGRHNWRRLVLERLSRKIKKDGILAVLKKGLAIDYGGDDEFPIGNDIRMISLPKLMRALQV